MNAVPIPSQQVEMLINAETQTLAEMARNEEAYRALKKKLRAIRNQLGGVKLGQSLAEEIAKNGAAPAE